MTKWKTILALILMCFAILFNWQWFWVLFLCAGFIDIIISGKIHFVEEVSKNETPKLYWFMIIIWFLLVSYSVYDYILA